MEPIWTKLYDAAKAVLNPRQVSNYIDAGGVAAAIESASGKIYVGVCVDTACTLGICAERNAIFNMLTNGENAFRRVIAIGSKGKAMAPCGACRELLMQLSPENAELQILADCETGKAISLKELVPDWWGEKRFR